MATKDLRLPPQDLEAEQSVLGALMIDKDAIIKEVLLKVNWPEIVRSEIAQRVIAEAGKPKY